MNELHKIKIHILRTLLFSNIKRFSEIKPKDMESSQFMFHLKDLILEGLVNKNDENFYELTELGKSFANKYDYDSKNPNIQAKHSIVICAFNSQNEILLYTRLKNPFYGCQGFMTGKVQYGEKIKDTSRREFFEETGLIGEPQIKAIRHFRVHDKHTHKLLEDKVMYIHIIRNPYGKITHDLIRRHFNLIIQSDCVLIANYMKKGVENYIGGNTFLEMGFAFVLGKPLFVINPLPELPYITEIQGMRPYILDNDLSKIKTYYHFN